MENNQLVKQAEIRALKNDHKKLDKNSCTQNKLI